MRRNPPEWMGKLDERKRYATSNMPIEAMYDTSSNLRDHWKPSGLWYGCGDEWVDFLEDAISHKFEEVAYVYEVELNIPKILKLNTVANILEFSKRFGSQVSMGRTTYIKWQEVAQMYDGIEICPYQYSLRDDARVDWYYPWDVASGCIWRPSGLKELRLVAQR